MKKNEKRYILTAFILTLLSGVSIYILDNYFMVEREWGLESSPYLSFSKAIHYLMSPLLILSIGFIIKSHISKKISNFKNESKKVTGSLITIGMILLIYTGQSLLFITNENLMGIVIYAHLITGLVMGLLFIKHLKN